MRRADRWIGIPSLFTLGLARRLHKASKSEPTSIGLLKTAALGDTVLMTGIIADLRAAFPTARLTLFAGPSNSAIAPLIEGLDHVVLINPMRPWSAIRAIRAQGIATMIDFGSWPRIDALLASTSGAPRIIGFRCAGQSRHFAFDEAVEHRSEQHEIDNYRALASRLGVQSHAPPHLHIPAGTSLPPELRSALNTRPFAVFHTCSGGVRRELKEWPHARWIELAKRAIATGHTVAFTGGKADGSEIIQIIQSLPPGAALDLSGKLTLAQTALLLTESAAVITVNTGIAHIAAALKARTIVLDGATSAARWGAIGPHVTSTAVPPPAGGFLNLGWEEPDQRSGQRADVMTLIDVDSVWNALSPRLNVPAEG